MKVSRAAGGHAGRKRAAAVVVDHPLFRVVDGAGLVDAGEAEGALVMLVRWAISAHRKAGAAPAGAAEEADGPPVPCPSAPEN